MKLHLLVIQNDDTLNVELWNPKRYDFVWNNDFTAFKPVKLLWWDNSSYIAYQCDMEGE